MKGISELFSKIAQNIQQTGDSESLDFSDLLTHFYVDVQNHDKENIDRITEWLDSRNLFAVPDLLCAHSTAQITICSKGNPLDLDGLNEKLPISTLPCARITRDKLPIINEINLTLNSVADEIINKNQNAFLILENKDGTPNGIIDAHSFATFLKSGNKTDIKDLVRKIFLIAKSNDSLIAAIDLMITEEKPYLIITNKINQITGFASLNTLFREYYPLTKPYLLVLKIENLLNQIIKEVGFKEEHFLSVIPSEQIFNRLKGESATMNDLTIHEKTTLLNKHIVLIGKKYGDKVQQKIPIICKELVPANKVRNDIFHFRKTLYINNIDLNKLNNAISLLNNLLYNLTHQK